MAKYERYATLGAVNWNGVWGDKETNLKNIKEKMRQASRLGVDILAFPENALSGYVCSEDARETKKPCEMHVRTSETIPGPSTEEIAELCKELDMYVVLGMPEKDKDNPEIQYVSAAVVGPEGVLGSQRKMHLATPPVWTEYYCFKPGNELNLFETKYGPIGISICHDFWQYPELSSLLALRGARVIFNPVGSISAPAKKEMIVNATTTRAQKHVSYIVSINHVGTELKHSYYGHSTIAGPGFPKFFKTLAHGEDLEEIVYATVDFKALENARKTFRVKEAGNWDLIAKEYQKIAEEMKK